MTTFLCIVAVYIVGIFVIGLPIGKKSLTAWDKWQSPKAGFWTRFLFPITASDGKKPKTNDFVPILIEEVDWIDMESKREYVGLTSLLWPIRLAWSLFAFPIFTVLAVLFFALPRLGSMLGKIVKV